MNIHINPTRAEWKALCRRPQIELEFLDSAVRNILNRVAKSGDEAVRELTAQFDKFRPQALELSHDEITASAAEVPSSLQQAIRDAAANIRAFHASQIRDEPTVETMPGVTCWRKAVPISRVGIYIPAGSAPLFSTVLMLGIPASLAGCGEIVLCTPPDADGKINPAVMFAANHVGITRVFRVGGAQAIAAMAFGTESIPNVYKIFGPGNQYVTRAKQMVAEEGVAIDMPAGPSEVLVVADKTANPEYVAADLLSQAEHGADSQVMLVLPAKDLLEPIDKALQSQLRELPRREIASAALTSSRAVVLDEGLIASFVNEYAPEHLILNVKNPEALASKISNAGSVFIGNFTPEAAGDYASGTNHTLPTNGFAKSYAGVSLDSFLKYITYQRISEQGLRNIGPIVQQMATAEQLAGHERAISIRLKDIQA